MHKLRSRLIAALAVAAVTVPFIGTATPAGAVAAGNGCIGSAVPAAHIGWFPAQPAAQSTLKVSCSFSNDTGQALHVTPSFTIHDHNMSLWHNGAARSVTTNGATALGATTINLVTASNGIAGLPLAPTQMNRGITGTGLAVRTTVDQLTGAGVATINTPTTAAIAGGTVLKIENSDIRTIDDATSTLPDLLNSPGDANFTAADVGKSVSGTGVPANTTIAAIINANQVQLSAPFSFTVACPCQATLGGTTVTTTTRQVTGASITSAVRINSTVAGWAATDASLKVVGVCDQGTALAGDDYTIPANVFILTAASGTNADTTGGLAFPNTGCNLTIGDPSATAPVNGEVVLTQGVTLNLSPTLVAGSDDCANEQPEGFAIVAKWNNPGSFSGSGIILGQPGRANSYQPAFPTSAIGQVIFDTAVTDYAGFVLGKRAASTTPLGGADPIGVVHYDFMVPFAPTGLALCPASLTSPGVQFSFTFNAQTTSQSTLPTGTGRPGTAQLRSTLSDADGGYNATVFVRSDDAAAQPTTPTNFQRLCVYPVGLPTSPGFQCGPG